MCGRIEGRQSGIGCSVFCGMRDLQHFYSMRAVSHGEPGVTGGKMGEGAASCIAHNVRCAIRSVVHLGRSRRREPGLRLRASQRGEIAALFDE